MARGFAAMDPEKQRELAVKGGQASQRLGTVKRFNSETGREAGRLGGLATKRIREQQRHGLS